MPDMKVDLILKEKDIDTDIVYVVSFTYEDAVTIYSNFSKKDKVIFLENQQVCFRNDEVLIQLFKGGRPCFKKMDLLLKFQEYFNLR